MDKVLIANRGEIAVRIAHACTDAGLTSVAIYADDDSGAFHVDAADEAYILEGSTSEQTYLNIDKIIDVAARCGADAIHPGYGFLSENADFAEAVIGARITWIGPNPETIRLLGNKTQARHLAEAAGAPLVPGSNAPVRSVHDIHEFASNHGFPIVIKAVFGGGGRGLKIARRAEDIDEAYDSAVREAEVAFGRGECLVERFLDRPRHIEAQVLADHHDHILVVGTRDCSLQRRNQKLVEEGPAPFLTYSQQQTVRSAATAICRESGYIGAGTIEFLLGEDGTFTFLEVNTRLQVEHPVTELTTGIDLVQAQFDIAAGKPLESQREQTVNGHAIEFRINAEDVGRGFLPSPGKVDSFVVPTGPGIRIDTGVRPGDVIPGRFDSLAAKLIVWGNDRNQAMRRAQRALDEFSIAGVATVLPFHRSVVQNEAFASTDNFAIYTSWIEQEWPAINAGDPEFSTGLVETSRRCFSIDIDGRRVKLGVPVDLLTELAETGGINSQPTASGYGSLDSFTSETGASDAIRAPMAGRIKKWVVEPGMSVNEGDPVIVLEAMKMEHTLPAPRTGTISKTSPTVANVGDDVTVDETLAIIA